jgi:hypothetical protein
MLIKKFSILYILVFVFLTRSSAQPSSLENSLYKILISENSAENPSFVVIEKSTNQQRKIFPKLRVAFSEKDPDLVSSEVDGYGGIAGWKTATGKVENNIYNLGGADVIATKVAKRDNQLIFSFKNTPYGKPLLLVALPDGNQAPSFIMGINPSKKGWFSLGFTGIESVSPSELNFLYQPLSWSWKRFPSQTCITEEAFSPTAACFVNKSDFTEGIAAAPEMIPYRFAHSLQWNNAGKTDNPFWSVFPADGPKGNSLFGFSVRNASGQAQPVLFAPLLGGKNSYMRPGKQYQFTCKYLFKTGDWTQGTDFLLKSIFKYKNERQNSTASLNQTLDNMLNFAMDDVFSGWNSELKGSDYRFDVPGAVKNVSAMHALGLALVSGDENIYKLRALPMIEYLMSREKFLFSMDDKPGQTQSPSHLLKGPSVDIGELSGLHQMTEGRTPAFSLELNRLFGKSRKLNLQTETGGGSWQDYLARYQVTKNPADLEKAKAGADDYLRQVYDRYSQTFHDAPGLKDKDASFTTDFGYRIYDLMQLYENTQTHKYLTAALTGAKQFLLWTRSHPLAPDSLITVNKKGVVAGVFPGRRMSNLEGSIFTAMDTKSQVAEQKVPAWQTSLIGLPPEASNTYAFGPVMLAHHAPWLLRLAKLGGDTLLRDAAYNAVIGRYANFPGYYFTSLETNVYQKEDYPMRPFYDVKYNAIFYNHVWPHLAILTDFLVSDFYYRSQGRIDFPSVYSPGYAFLTSKVYGNKSGTFMGTPDVRLWIPRNALQSSSVALNHIFGIHEKSLFMALANTSPEKVSQQIRLNPDVIPWNAGQTYRVSVYSASGSETFTTLKGGLTQVEVPAAGMVSYKIEGLNIQVPLFKKLDEDEGIKLPQKRYARINNESEKLGIATAMVIQSFADFANFYIYSDRTEKHWQSALLKYKIGPGKWQTLEDKNYPFEFNLHLDNPAAKIEYQLTAKTNSGEEVSLKPESINY